MAGLLQLVFVGVVLVMSPGPDPALTVQQPDQDVIDVNVFPAVAGRILGAASACDDIDEDRVSDAADRALELTAANADDEADAAMAKAMMEQGAQLGRQDVKTGKADCSLVDASLSKLEQIESLSDDQDPGAPDTSERQNI
jgi:hypothetical protein